MSFILKNIVTNKKINFWNFINFFKVGVGEGVVFYYTKRFQTTSPQHSMRYFVPIKKTVANPHPLKFFFQNIIKLKKNFWKFFNFWGKRDEEGVGGNFIHSKNSFKT